MRKILGALGSLLFCAIIGVCVWYFFLGGRSTQNAVSIPETPENLYTDFFYCELENEEKIAYEMIMDKLFSFPEKIRIPVLDDDGLSVVFEAILYDNAEIFFLDDSCQTSTTGNNSYFVPKYTMTKEEYEVKLAQLKQVKSTVLKNTSSLENDFEIEKYVHDFIIDRCKYKEKTGGEYSSAYGCLINSEASCEGYTRATKYLLDALGIENHFALGTLKDAKENSPGHAWNIVNIDGKYYHLDVTWDDPYGAQDECRYTFFNLTDDMIGVTHDVEQRFLGKCNSTDENYYVVNEISFSSYGSDARSGIAKEIAKQADDGVDIMSVRFENKTAFSQAKDALFEADGIYSVLMTASVLSSTKISRNKVAYSLDDKHLIIRLSNYIAE